MNLSRAGTATAKVLAAVMLFMAVRRHGYDYYTVLRWVVCGVAGFSAFRAGTQGKAGWAWILAIVALLFNPFAPVHLKRETWAFVDIVAALILLATTVTVDLGLKRREPEDR